MALELYWGSGSPYSWRVQLALEYKRLAYESRLLQFSMQEHKSPQMLRMNPRGRVPVLRDGDYVVFESLACLLYLDRKYPEPPLFGRTPEEAGTIMRVICEYQAYAESHLMQIVYAVFFENIDERAEEVTRAMHIVAGEARTIEGRLSNSDWLVGARFRGGHGGVPRHHAAAARHGKARSGRPALALPADGDHVPGHRALDPTLREPAGLRPHLSAALARRRAARLSQARQRPRIPGA
jgi:glutathione S-transferase